MDVLRNAFKLGLVVALAIVLVATAFVIGYEAGNGTGEKSESVVEEIAAPVDLVVTRDLGHRSSIFILHMNNARPVRAALRWG